MADKKDPPIEELNYLCGVRIVDIGDYRVSRGMSRRPFSGCHHHRLVYDERERRIWCRDCERDVEAFDAFLGVSKNFDMQDKILSNREKKIAEAEAHTLISLAAKEIDKAWRSKRMIPACPHCKNGLFPEDFKNGIKQSLSRDYALARLNRKEKP